MDKIIIKITIIRKLEKINNLKAIGLIWIIIDQCFNYILMLLFLLEYHQLFYIYIKKRKIKINYIRNSNNYKV
jgi:hypothetical protein